MTSKQLEVVIDELHRIHGSLLRGTSIVPILKAHPLTIAQLSYQLHKRVETKSSDLIAIAHWLNTRTLSDVKDEVFKTLKRCTSIRDYVAVLEWIKAGRLLAQGMIDSQNNDTWNVEDAKSMDLIHAIIYLCRDPLTVFSYLEPKLNWQNQNEVIDLLEAKIKELGRLRFKDLIDELSDS